MNKKLTIINIALALVALLLVYLVYRSISEPVVFENIRKEREVEVIQRLKDIRTTQSIYKQTYNCYTGSFDTLIDFI